MMKKWLSAFRLRTLPLAASSVIAGSAMAWHQDIFSWTTFWLALITTFLLQVLSNLANDYGDYSHGVDNEQRVGPARAMQSGAITKSQMQRALVINTILALISGISLLWFSLGERGEFYPALLLLGMGMLAIAAAFKYTVGKNPYGYLGLGDLAVFIFFGLTGVIGTYYLHTGILSAHVLLPAATIGLFSAAVLNLNNLRDHENDRSSGKNTLVVRMGFSNGKIYQMLLITGATCCAIVLCLMSGDAFYRWFTLLIPALQWLLLVKVFRTKIPADLDGELKKVALSTFAYSLLLWILF